MVTIATQTEEVSWLNDQEQEAWRSFIFTAKLVLAELERGWPSTTSPGPTTGCW
ncbi:hypothetical protein ACFQZ4_21265 [Catellatospora coxensis]